MNDDKKIVSWKPGEPLPLQFYPKEILDDFFCDFKSDPELDKKVKEITDRYIKKSKSEIIMISTPDQDPRIKRLNPYSSKSVQWIIDDIIPEDMIILGQKKDGRIVTDITYRFDVDMEKIEKNRPKSNFQAEYEGCK